MAVVKSVSVLPQVIEDVAEIIHANAGKKIIWFGYSYSHWVDTLQAALKERSLGLDYVVDNDKLKWGRVSPFGVIVSPPSHILTTHKDDSVVLISSNFSADIVAGILKTGYPQSNIIVMKSPNEYAEGAEKQLDVGVNRSKQMNLRELQLCELDILKEFKKFCDENKLRYFLSGGTCYGAAHYNGFIPWDDDIDVMLPIGDFMKFVETFPKGGRYEVIFWPENEDFFFPYAQLIDNNTDMIYSSFPNSLLQGVFVDVFPTAGSPSDADEIRYRRDLNCYLDAKWRWYYNSRNILKEPLIDDRGRIWRQKFDLSFDESEMVTTPFESSYSYEPWVLPREVFEYGETLTFEGETFSVMKGWKRFLDIRYPNWHPLSEAEQAAFAHPMKAFWK